MPTAPVFRKLEPEEKKEKILASGTQTILFICPLCAKASALKIFDRDFDISTLELLDYRRTGGKGSGFYREKTEGTLGELNNDSKYDETIKLIKERCKKILKILNS